MANNGFAIWLVIVHLSFLWPEMNMIMRDNIDGFKMSPVSAMLAVIITVVGFVCAFTTVVFSLEQNVVPLGVSQAVAGVTGAALLNRRQSRYQQITGLYCVWAFAVLLALGAWRLCRRRWWPMGRGVIGTVSAKERI